MEIASFWKTIVNTLQDGLLVVDPRGNILFMNAAAERLTGYTSEELVGRSCRVLNCTGCDIIGRGAAERWCRLFAQGDVRAKRCLLTHKDGRAVHVVKNAAVLRDERQRVLGAVETLSDLSEIVRQQQEIETLRRSCQLDDGFHGLIGASDAMRRVYELVENVAPSDAPVMIQGPSGAGKELVARAIHDSGVRRGGPFIKVNCAALNENLLESELFGHVKGAYTGADRQRVGRFEAAHGGTIFLDEIGDVPASIQAKLLRVLEEKEIERVGDHTPVPVDVRIVTATHRDLEVLVREGRFRGDLYFRVNVFPIVCPALADRREDIPALVQHFVGRMAARTGKRIEELDHAALELFCAYDWPGNVRELRNAIEYAFVLCHGPAIECAHLPPRIRRPEGPPRAARPGAPETDPREELVRALREAKGNRTEAARRLGVSRVTVWKRIKRFGIDPAKEAR